MGKAAGRVLPAFDLVDLIVLKHFSVYTMFIIGSYGVYSIAKRRLSCQYGGLLAAALFFLSPRLFGNAFYNSKDIVFLSFFVMSVNYVLLAAEDRNPKNIFLSALFTALAVSARFIGIVSMFSGCFIWIVNWHRSHIPFGRIFVSIAGFTAGTLLLIYAFYPFLWPSPFQRASDVISAMSAFTRHGDDSLLDGKFVRSSLEPFYVVHWIAITLPLMFIAMSLFGQISGFILMLRRTLSLSLWKNGNELCDYITTGLGIVPVLATLIKHPWLYDSWRHLYFLIPCFSVSAAVGIFSLASFLRNEKARKTAALWIGSAAIMESLAGIICFFPYPNCYFNEAAGTNLISKYDLDYSGTTGYEALMRILNHNKNTSSPVSIASDSTGLAVERLGLWMKLISFDGVFPDYVITNRSQLTEIEKTLYHEFSAIRTPGGEVLMRILAPNANRDSFCRAQRALCEIKCCSK